MITMSDNPRTAFQQLSEPEIWVEKHGMTLYRYALFRLRDPDVAEETVQETFLAALRGLDEMSWASPCRCAAYPLPLAQSLSR
jgi:DNA-directed RNA polymerase specialized sigma24 family protein